MAENFSDSLVHVIQQAFTLAEKRNQTEVTNTHLLKALLEEPNGYFTSIISALTQIQLEPVYNGSGRNPEEVASGTV